MTIKYTITNTVDSETWNNELQKSDYATFFQTAEYLTFESNMGEKIPFYITIQNEDKVILGQLGLFVIKSAVAYSSSNFQQLLNKFAQLGHNVTILTPDLEWSGEKYEPNLDKKIHVHKVDTPSKSNLKIAARRCFDNMKKNGIKLGQKEEYDFIFTIFHPFHLVPKAAVSCGEKLGIPVIIKVDDAVYQKATGLKNLQRKIEKMYNARTLQKGDKILVPNEYTKELVHNFYNVDLKKIAITPNGTEIDNFNKSDLKMKQVIFSGAMYQHRGIDILLESLAKILLKIPDMKLQLLGNGPEKDRLERIVEERGFSKNVEFKGWIDREKIPEYLAESKIGIGPLRSTTVTKNALPIKILEYMASSLPIISWENTLPKDVLKNGKNGFFVNSINELSEKIIFLFENDATCLEFGEESKKIVSKYDWEDIVQKIIKKNI